MKNVEYVNDDLDEQNLLVHDRPKLLEQAIREKFNSSLRYLIGEVQDELKFDQRDLENMSQHILSHRVSASSFAEFYDLVFNITDLSNEETRQRLNTLIAGVENKVSFEVSPYDERLLGKYYHLFAKLVFAGFSEINPMAAPPKSGIESYRAQVYRAMDIIKMVDKSIYDEIDVLINQVIFCRANTNPDAQNFSGATSLTTWGALFLSIDGYSTLEEVIAGLVHETTHAALFGIDEQQKLVLNPDDETFPSPLRTDNRPMDGLYHATIVSARVVLVLRKIERHRVSAELDKENISSLIDYSNDAFYSGLETINEYGKLSDEAQEILNRFSDFMQASEK